MLTIPDTVLNAARLSGLRCPAVADWITAQLAAVQLPACASPAEWPAPLWQAYEVLRDASGAPSTADASARALVTNVLLCATDVSEADSAQSGAEDILLSSERSPS